MRDGVSIGLAEMFTKNRLVYLSTVYRRKCHPRIPTSVPHSLLTLWLDNTLCHVSRDTHDELKMGPASQLWVSQTVVWVGEKWQTNSTTIRFHSMPLRKRRRHLFSVRRLVKSCSLCCGWSVSDERSLMPCWTGQQTNKANESCCINGCPYEIKI